MGDREPTKSMVEGAFLAAITAILFIISLYIPLLGTLVSFLCPLPIIISYLRHGLKFTLISVLVAGALVSVIAGPLQGVMVLLGFGILGVTLGYTIKKESPFQEIIFLGSIASLFSKILILLLGMWLLDINPLIFDAEQIDRIITQSLDFYRSIGLTGEQLDLFKENLTRTLDTFKVVFPALLVLASIFDVFLNYIVARLVLKRFGYQLADFAPFSEWRAPASFFWSYFLGIILILLGTKYETFLLNKIGMNLQIFFTVVFLIYGLSLVDFLMERFKLKSFLKWIIFVIVFIQPILSQLATWMGMLDVWIDFRKLITAKEK